MISWDLCLDSLNDMDTTAAIVGGIVGAHTGRAGIPSASLSNREPLPSSVPQPVSRPESNP
jgi:hypothetical protein